MVQYVVFIHVNKENTKHEQENMPTMDQNLATDFQM